MLKVYITRVGDNYSGNDEAETVILDLATDDDTIGALNLRALADKLDPNQPLTPWAMADPVATQPSPLTAVPYSE